ncbi:hypothetical protein SAY87_002220 [Trapa incisa]|uniref:VOC domain-containing protein n=1 Tax=Trapa incisa TaxID=236973 RepID=A0AAN7JTW9_9MYRT|nr:hypothetical protein SAY87_002220 [Trapa incisa]
MSELPPAVPLHPPPPGESEDIPPFLLSNSRLPESASSSLYKHRAWSADMYRDEVWERRKGRHMARLVRRSKSVADEDLDEIKACIELGFSFEPPEIDPRLSDTLPGLPFYYAVLSNTYLHSMASKSRSNSVDGSESCSSNVSPADSPGHQSMFSPGDNPKVVKTRLRQWARANLCNVRSLSSSLPQNRVFPKDGRGRTNVTVKAKASVEGDTLVKEAESVSSKNDIGALCIHHVGILCENLERSLDFYQNLLGLEINEARPNEKLPYRGAWLWVGNEMIHLMELPNPDPLTGRPQHGGLDRHTCIALKDVYKLRDILDKAGIPYTMSRSGRAALFTRDPDANALEFVQVDS